jgi:SET domain-containing protein
MLRVPTYVASSKIAGVGLFAATDLPANAVIWEYSDGVDWKIAPSELMLFPEPFQSRLRHYLYQEDTGVYVLCGDNAKYMNHSEEPNCDDSGGEYTVTTRAIRAGEELTCDYRLFDRESKDFGVAFNGQQPVETARAS